MRTKVLFFAILVILGFATRFAYFGRPAEAVFDEVYFGRYAADYVSGSYYFDPHPPLGKLILAIGAKASPVPPSDSSFSGIGTKFSDSSYLYLRFLPAFAGAILPALIFLLCLGLSFGAAGAFFAGLLAVFETSLIGQARFMLIDMFLIDFGLGALILYLLYRKRKNIWLLGAGALLAGMALSVKWTGVSFLGIIGLFELAELIRSRSNWRIWLRQGMILVSIPLLVYIGSFAVHFKLLPNPGQGDAFMSADFKTKSFPQKFIELNRVMYESEHQPQMKTHPYQSAWYTWPIMQRPIYYWTDSAPGRQSRIYLFGNPAVYWLSAASVVVFFVLLVYRILKKRSEFLEMFLAVGFLANFLPFIAVSRGMFLYHYFPALAFVCVLAAYLAERILNPKRRLAVYGTAAVLAAAGFVYFAPLVYGFPLSQAAYDAKVWLSSWL